MIEQWNEQIEESVHQELQKEAHNDASHDFGHFTRVTTLACRFAKQEGGNELVVYAAGMLHDIVSLPKTDPNSKKSSLLASHRAEAILTSIGFPSELIPQVCHAIHAHSFSAKVEPKTTEAKCVQDADRMEALGAFGLMRVFYCSGKYGSELIHNEDPMGEVRQLNDKEYALDHFGLKLLTLAQTMKTKSGRQTADKLSHFLEDFRTFFVRDQREGNVDSGCFKIAKVYQNAGLKQLSLFHLDDPLAKNGRHLEPQQYALDTLLNDEDPYILKFLKQFQFEFNGYTTRGPFGDNLKMFGKARASGK